VPIGQVAGPIHRWTRAEYERIVDVGGFLPDARLDGEIVDMSPQKAVTQRA